MIWPRNPMFTFSAAYFAQDDTDFARMFADAMELDIKTGWKADTESYLSGVCCATFMLHSVS